MKHSVWVFMIAVSVIACSKEVALNKNQFTALLIDMHMADGALEVAKFERRNEKDNYLYYNDLFKKYGITRADFDSCLNYYTRNSTEFNRIYDAVIDTLSRRQTQKMRLLSQFTKNDTVNLFPGYTMIVADTLRLDSTRVGAPKKDSIVYGERVVEADTVHFDKRNQFILIEVDSIVPGMYHFFTTLKWNKRVQGRSAKIESYFLSAGNDTLKVMDVPVSTYDTIRSREYKWEHYVKDSMYNKLVIKIVDTKDVKNAKVKTKEIDGWVTKTRLNQVYVGDNKRKQLEEEYKQREEMMKAASKANLPKRERPNARK